LNEKIEFRRSITENINFALDNMTDQDRFLYSDIDKLWHLIKEKVDTYGWYPDKLNDDDIDTIHKQIRKRLNIQVKPTNFIDNQDKNHEDWYSKDLINSQDNFFWNRYKKYLEKQNRAPQFIQRLDKDSEQIVSRLGNPKRSTFNVKGMVIGHVQSGKTMSYTAVINKAIDSGYRLIIVLAGLTNSLRTQTQARMNKELIGKDIVEGTYEKDQGSHKVIGVGLEDNDKTFGHVATTVTQDFNKQKSSDLMEYDSIKDPIIIIAKKNVKVLESINKRLSNQNSRQGLKATPVLLIDDESDNASVNTAKPDQDPKAINREIRSIINNCKQISYLAYTATPMANIFIRPEDIMSPEDKIDLFPSDFICSLNPPNNYRGGDFYFSDRAFDDSSNYDLDPIEDIDDYEEALPLGHKKDHEITSLPESLENSIYYYFVVVAIKDLRREKGAIEIYGEDDQLDSMMINVSRFSDVQLLEVTPLVQIMVTEIENAIKAFININNDNFIISKLRDTFNSINLEDQLNWDEVKDALVKMDAIQVWTANGPSQDIIEFNKNTTTKYIIVGGMLLSRGLTIPGLTVSYFLRNTKMYDTLMQMARWFGYRDGYTDLTRVYMPSFVADNFVNVNQAINELFGTIRYMGKNRLSPKDFGLKVESHSKLLVTAKNKMQSSEELEISANLSGEHHQTWNFYQDHKIEEANRRHTFKFLKNIMQDKTYDDENNIMFKDIHFELISNFFAGFKTHPNNSHIGTLNKEHDLFTGYINEYKNEELAKWDVGIFCKRSGKSEDKVLDIEALLDEEIYYENRKIAHKISYFDNLALSKRRSIVSPNGRKVGLVTSDDIHEREKPILILHFLKANKEADTKLEKKINDCVGKNFIGLSIFFPNSKDSNRTSKKYVVNETYLKEHGLGRYRVSDDDIYEDDEYDAD
jgi:hypothetical protein